MPAFYRWDENGCLLLFCHLQPSASRDEFVGQHGERLKIRIAAPPVDGKANSQLIKFIAKQFAVTRARVCIDSGESGKLKTLRIIEPGRLPPALGISSAPATS